MDEGKQLLSKALVDSAPDATVLADAAGRIVRVNALAASLLGYAEPDLIGRPVLDLLPERLHDPFAGQLAAFAERPQRHALGPGAGVELCLLRRDGSELPVEVSLGPVDTRSGLYAVASLRDLEPQLRETHSLRSTVARLRAVFERAPVGVAICELDGRFGQVNAALCTISGYSEATLGHLSIFELVHPEDVANFEELLGALVRGETDLVEREQRCLRADGEAIWTSLRASILYDREGQPEQLLVQLADTSERRQLEGRLRDVTDHDPLTGLLNRHGLEPELERHLAHVKRYGPRGALLVLDIDHFRAINDTVGPEAGDRVIAAVADRLARRLRSSDMLARLGGDEFAILLPEADVAAARRVAAAIVADIHQEPVQIDERTQRAVTVSVGVALFGQEAGAGEEVLVDADLAMYDAKEAGRDRVSVGTNGDRRGAPIKARLAWIDRIHEALDSDRMTLFAQPVAMLERGDPSHGHIEQHELLLRMIDEHGDVIPPSAFLPVAERYDLIQELDRWVVRQAIRLVQRQPAGTAGVEINVSSRSLADSSLLDVVESELVRSRVDPARLTFEVAETAAIANVRLARSFAEGVAGLGCRFALDDFGAGFGSFYYLKHIPFDYLKIGREFVTGCLSNRTDQLVIESLVGIARGLSKQTIAVGVEDRSTASFLRRGGVDLAQGFHLGRPYAVLRSEHTTARPLRVS